MEYDRSAAAPAVHVTAGAFPWAYPPIALTVPVQRQFFGWPWSRARHHFADHRTFDETIARISGEPSNS